MGLRPGRCYREIKGKPYTRREYMGGVPGNKITIYDMGVQQDYNCVMHLVSGDSCRIRHNALESARIAVNKYLTKIVGRSNYYLKIRVYPHHVIRENKMASGAGADRFSQGMSRAFGKAIGTAAVVREGQKLITVKSDKQHIETVKRALKMAAMKFPGHSTLLMEQ